MSEATQGTTQPPPAEIRILDLLAVFVRRWRLIASVAVATVAITVLVWVLRPQTYKASTVLVRAVSPQGGGRMLALSEGSLNLGQIMGGGTQQAEQLVNVVLQSRTMADSVVMSVGGDSLDAEQQAEIRNLLKYRMEIRKQEGNGLIVSVRGHDPALVTRIANVLPDLANRLMTQLSMQAALRRADFLESQLDRANNRLAVSQQQMVRFQTTQSAPELQEQARRTLDVAAELQQQMLDQQIRIAEIRRASTPSNPDLQAAQAKLTGMREQLSQLTAGARGSSQVLLSLKDSPELQATATRLLRDYTRDEQVYTALTTALAEAQVDAKNDLPVLTVLDPAILPQAPDGPTLPKVVALALLAGLVFGSVAAFTSEFIRNAQRDEGNAGFFMAWQQMKRDVSHALPGTAGRAAAE